MPILFFAIRVVKDGVFLYGDMRQYNLFKLYAILLFPGKQKMRELRDFIIIKKAGTFRKNIMLDKELIKTKSSLSKGMWKDWKN